VWNSYERLVVHILDNPNQADRDIARTILGWVARAERPLLWKEVQSIFCITIEDESADPDFRLMDPCKHYCGALVEVDGERGSALGPDGMVEFVHETARM
jgi:hypothetical protein